MLLCYKSNNFCMTLKVSHALVCSVHCQSAFAEASKLLHLEVLLFHVTPLFDYFKIYTYKGLSR